MYFTRESLEQTTLKIAEYRTDKIVELLPESKKILDVCCGVGGDTIAFAKKVDVIAVDINSKLIEYAEKNLAVYGLKDKVKFVVGDIQKLLHQESFLSSVSDVDCIFFDPSRRKGKKRFTSGESYIPPLSLIKELKKINQNLCVCVAPAINYEKLSFDSDVEFISFKRQCKEALLWFGVFKKEKDKRTIYATKLPEKTSLARKRTKAPIVTNPQKYLYEPDPAFIRAHLISEICEKYQLSLIDEKTAFLTGNKLLNSSLLNGYLVKSYMKYDLKQLNKTLAERNIGKADIKARAFPINPKTLRRKIILEGKRKALLIFTKVKNEKVAFICQYT
jgi:SAM-dependent methyltransferase